MKNKYALHNLKFTILLSLSACFMLFFFAPLEIYFTNIYSVWYDLMLIFPICLIMFTVSFILSTAVLSLIDFAVPGLYPFVYIVCLIATLCTYIQGNYLISDIPAIDGADINWSDFSNQRIYTIILWLSVSAIVLLICKYAKYKPFMKYSYTFLLCFIGMLAVSLTTICFVNKGYTDKEDVLVSTAGEFEMSTDRNFIILLFDSIDCNALTRLMDKHPEYAETLSDFTYYDNVVGNYAYTSYAVPFLLSGQWYNNEQPLESYLVEAYDNAPLFSYLEKLNYRLGMYESDAPINENTIKRFENIIDDTQTIRSIPEMIKVQIKLIGLKYLPYDLKKLCVVMPGDVPRVRKFKYGAESFDFEHSNLILYDAVRNRDFTSTTDRWFKFIHVEGAHIPFRYDAQLNEYTDHCLTYNDNIEASMTLMMAYIQKLKDSGYYDNSCIMIASDHGYAEFTGKSLERHHPILIVKGFNETKDSMTVLSTPISLEDYCSAYPRLINGEAGDKIFNNIKDEYRERRILNSLKYNAETFVEYIQTGHAGDMDSIVPTGNEYIRKKK